MPDGMAALLREAQIGDCFQKKFVEILIRRI
jgi:hypothetical protein